MKRILLLILSTRLLSASFAQENDIFQKLYFINGAQFFQFVDEKPDEYHLVYTYAYWCKPCREISPVVFEIAKSDRRINFYPLLVEKHGSAYIKTNLETMIQQYGFRGNVFIPELDYAKKYRKRYEIFVNELAPGHDNFGYSLILLFKGRKLLFASNWEMSAETKLNALRSALSTSD